MTAPALIEVFDPFAAVRALNRLRTAGFALSLDAGRLLIKPISRLTDVQRAYLHTHKPALVALLMDADIVYRDLVQAGTAGLAWREGTPADWPDARLLAADEVLYGDGRMVNRNDRRYLRSLAPDPDADSLPGENAPSSKAPIDASYLYANLCQRAYPGAGKQPISISYANTVADSERLLARARAQRLPLADNFRSLIIITALPLASRCLPTLKTGNSR